LKIVNRSAAAQSVRVEFGGLKALAPNGQAIKIAPVTSNVDGLGASLARAFPPYSITVLVMRSR
jgi:hypothetical protein